MGRWVGRRVRGWTAASSSTWFLQQWVDVAHDLSAQLFGELAEEEDALDRAVDQSLRANF